MNVYKTSDIRNVVFLGHGGAGKTTLAEAVAYATGEIARKGRIEDGNTISDYDKEEISRHFSISASVVPVEWNGLKINMLDAPGYFDFVGQMEDARLDEKTKNNSIRIPAILIRGVDIMPSLASFTRV